MLDFTPTGTSKRSQPCVGCTAHLRGGAAFESRQRRFDSHQNWSKPATCESGIHQRHGLARRDDDEQRFFGVVTRHCSAFKLYRSVLLEPRPYIILRRTTLAA